MVELGVVVVVLESVSVVVVDCCFFEESFEFIVPEAESEEPVLPLIAPVLFSEPVFEF